MTARRDEFARIITLENGKARADAIGEVTYAAEFFRWFSEEATARGRALDPRTSVRSAHSGSPEARRRRRARHAVELPGGDGDSQDRACIGGRLLCHRQAASETPLTMLALMPLLEEAGVPAGVVNVVPSRSSRAVVDAMLTIGCRPGSEACDGARGLCANHGLRGRGSRRRG